MKHRGEQVRRPAACIATLIVVVTGGTYHVDRVASAIRHAQLVEPIEIRGAGEVLLGVLGVFQLDLLRPPHFQSIQAPRDDVAAV